MMERIILGKTGLTINRLGFGGIPIQRVSETEAIRTVLHAVDKGVDFIDTARGYTSSEERIGKALAQTNAPVVMATKSQSKTADAIRRDVDASLRALGLEFIHLYQCHFVRDMTDYDNIRSPNGAVAGLVKAREEGLIGHIGVTSHSLDLVLKILDDDIFETIMVCFSFLEPAARERVIPKAFEKNVGVIAMKSFSGGVIENPALAIKFALSHPGVALIPGVESPSLFDQNWKIYESGGPLTPTEQREIDTIRNAQDKVFCRRCDYCLPCTEEIPIQIIMGLRMILKRAGEGFLDAPWINKAIDNARRCTACGECAARCPYGLPIPELIRENIAWLDETVLKP